MTGHENGIITIALAEADGFERERRRLEMGEPYRTLLGHSATRSGIIYGTCWSVTVGSSKPAARYSVTTVRITSRRYNGTTGMVRYVPDWQQRYVSAYAAVHPWEDFAETWAHYLHIVDTLEMAGNFGIEVRPAADMSGSLSARIDFDPYVVDDFPRILDAWLPFVFAMNSVKACATCTLLSLPCP